MKRHWLACFALPLLVATTPAQTNRDDLTPLEIRYTTRISEDLGTVHITLDVANLSRPFTHLAMPNWTPGAYGIGRYGNRVQELTARSGNRDLETTKMDFQTWSVATDGVSQLQVTYSVDAPRGRGRRGRRGAPPAEPQGPVTGFQVSGPNTYLYIPDAKSVPVEARYSVPSGWRVANGLLQSDDPMVRTARDYDTFIDAPTIYGIYREHTFEVNGTPFSCVYFDSTQQYDFDVEAYTDVVRRIVTYIGELFGSYPFPDYVFLFSLPRGGGGLEHLNSTAIGLNSERLKNDVNSGGSISAHEFFHTWNVKRIRPKVLGPFEYEHENYTGNLWVSEGWTSYYGDLTLVRTGIVDQPAFLGMFERYIRTEMNKEGRKDHSVFWASRNAWHRDAGVRPRVDYYAKGEILGAMIDLRIRQETDNKKSLDDVMRFMNRWFAEKDVGFEEGDVERACTAISNYDFSEFFARHVYGTLDPPMQESFSFAGIEYTESMDGNQMVPSLRFLDDITDKQRRIREGWLTGK